MSTSTYNLMIKKLTKCSQIFFSLGKKFLRTQKRVRISHGKRAIGVRAIDVLLYVIFLCAGFRSTLNPLLFHHGAYNYTCFTVMSHS